MIFMSSSLLCCWAGALLEKDALSWAEGVSGVFGALNPSKLIIACVSQAKLWKFIDGSTRCPQRIHYTAGCFSSSHTAGITSSDSLAEAQDLGCQSRVGPHEHGGEVRTSGKAARGGCKVAPRRNRVDKSG